MKKDIKFSTRMASQDREAIKDLAAKAHLSVSNYVTACCLGKQIIVIDCLKEFLTTLRGIGNNLNQLTTLAHMGRISVVDLSPFTQELSEMNQTLHQIVERKRW